MAKTRILLTGADGLIGSHILDQLLGHDTVSIRSIVETQEAASSLLQQYPRVSESSLEVQIASEQDLMVPGVFDELLSDDTKPFQAVVYTSNATPFSEADCLARYINLETEAIINFLTSVNDVAQGVSRVVIVTTLTSFARWLAVPQIERYLPESSVNNQMDPENILATCQASDNVVHDAVSKWAREAGLRFDIVWISAPSVYGPSIRPLHDSSNLLEANRRIWNIFNQRAGNLAETSPYGLAHFLDVRDFASATIRALFTGRAANKRFMISAGVMPSTSEIASQLVTRFPDLANYVHIDGRPSRAHGVEDSSLLFLDSYLIQSVLGISRFYSAEQTLMDTAQQIMDLIRRKSWRSITQS